MAYFELLPFREGLLAEVDATSILLSDGRRTALRLVKHIASPLAQPISCSTALSSKSLPRSLGFIGVPGAPGGNASGGNASAISWPTVMAESCTS